MHPRHRGTATKYRSNAANASFPIAHVRADSTAQGWKRSWQAAGDEFHLYVGYCIAAWARVDDALFEICRGCLGPTEQSAIIYYRTPGLDLRFKLTDELVLSILPRRQRKSGGHDHPDVKAWPRAIARHEDLLAIRRRIAYYPVANQAQPAVPVVYGSFAYGETPYGALDLEPSFQIYASHHERMRQREADQKPLKKSSLREHVADVWELMGRLRHFDRDTFSRYAKSAS
jgi:hypothetical protein